MMALQVNFPMEITPIPIPSAEGKIFRGSMPWTILRDKDDTFARLKANKIGKIVLLTSEHETNKLLGRNLKALYESKDITVIHFPIESDQLPDYEPLAALISQIESDVAEGESIMVHCMEGKRRTGFILACLAAKIMGLSTQAAIQKVRDDIDQSIKLDRFEPLISKFSTGEEPRREAAHAQAANNAGGHRHKRHGPCTIQ